MDFKDIKGLEHCKRGLEVAAAGSHNVLLIGPPGSGKHSLAEAFATITNRQVQIVDATSYTDEDFTMPRGALIVALMRPCPCGYFTDPRQECVCTPKDIRNHLSKIPGRLLDRIEVHLEVPKLSPNVSARATSLEGSDKVKARVETADTLLSEVEDKMDLDKEANELLKLAILELGISSMAYDKILSISKTIAALDGKEVVEAHHISEAISYRSLDRNLWG